MRNTLSYKQAALFCCLCFSGMLFADDDLEKEQIPNKVHEAFKAAFPKAHKIEYDLEHENGHAIYEITFKVGKRTIQAHYNEDGTLLRLDRHNKDDDDD